MPRPQIDPRWRQRIASLAEEGLSAEEIQAAVDVEATGAGQLDQAPSLSTVRRYRRQHIARYGVRGSEEQRFAWPGGMGGPGALPWDASRSALDLVRLRRDDNRPPPTLREAKWFCRLRQAAPTISDATAVFLTVRLAEAEFVSVTSGRPGFTLPDLTEVLARERWSGPILVAGEQLDDDDATRARNARSRTGYRSSVPELGRRLPGDEREQPG